MGGCRSDSGSASLDYVGMVTLGASVVLALLLAGPGVGRAMVAGVQNATCAAFDLGCDASTPTEAMDELPAPEEPCEASSHTATVDLGVDVAIVSVGGNAVFAKTRTSDGQWHVTVSQGFDAGVEVGIGAEGHVSAGNTQLALGANADAAAGLTGEAGRTWDFATEDEANDFVEAAQTQTARDAVSSVPVVGWLADQAVGLAVDEWNPPEADETFVAGGLEASASASASAGVAGVGAEVGLSELIGVKTKQDGEQTFYYKAGGEVGGEAGVPFGPGVSGSASQEGVIAVTLSPEGELAGLTLEGTRVIGTDASWHADVSSLAAFVDSGLAASQDTTTRAWSASLDLTDPEAHDAAVDFVRAAGINLVFPDPIHTGDTFGAGQRIVDLMREQGTISAVDYSGGVSEYGAGASVAAGLKLGASGGIGFEDRAVTGAQYWNGSEFVPWEECR